jgi:hypothetical protein
MEAKQTIQLAGNMQLRQSQLDVEIEGIGHYFRAILAFTPACFFRLENCSAALTLIPMKAVAGYPSLNSVPHKLEIDSGLAVLRMLEELGRVALRAQTRLRTLEGLVWSYDLRRPFAKSRSGL